MIPIIAEVPAIQLYIGAFLALALLIFVIYEMHRPSDDPEDSARIPTPAVRVGDRTFFNVTQEVQQEVARVEAKVEENSDPTHILFEISNAEVRQTMIKKYGGFEALLAKVPHEILHTDDYGVLFRVWVEKLRKHYYYVKVVNGTPEPDGSFREYYLEVPPDMDTAKEAIAWTYGLHPDDYDVAVRT